MQRVDTPEFWQSVTGGLEEGEIPSDAAVRELFEETGISATHNDKLIDHQSYSEFEIAGAWRQRYHPEQTHNREHLFSIQLNSTVPIKLNADEHSSCVWLSADKAIAQATSRTNKQAIRDIVLPRQNQLK